MIIVTGAAGFIGSCLISKLNNVGIIDLVLVDDFSKVQKEQNYSFKKYSKLIEREKFLDWFKLNAFSVEYVFHIGARTDTTEFDKKIFDDLNLNYTKQIWEICAKHNISLSYASSAATYGLGEFGYEDDEIKIEKLKPLNPYGESKNDFDKWAIKQNEFPPRWQGFKFFNVYGPNEYHKGRMASVIFHAFNQIQEKGVVRLFKSHNPKYTDGGQLRDFIYVKDLIDVLFFAFENKIKNGIYNLGTGEARTFTDLANSTFVALGKKPNIEFIDTPIDIRDKYQYFTEAKMEKLIGEGYSKKFTSLEDGVFDYVKNFLVTKKYY